MLNSSAWILDDCGIICHKKPEHYKKRKPPIFEGVGRYRNLTWTGFIGYTIPLAIGLYIYRFLIEEIPIHAIIILILFPFVMMGLLIPVILIHDGLIPKKKEKYIKMWKLEESQNLPMK